VDFGVLAGLARYHAARLRSGVEYEFFARNGEHHRLAAAASQFRTAVEQWKEISRLTDGFYYDHMVFNRPPEQIGHWKDELPFLENELARLIEIERVYGDSAKALDWKVSEPRHKLTMKAKETAGVWSRWADLTPVREPDGGPAERYTQIDPRAAVQNVMRRVRYARILHTPLRFASEGTPIRIQSSLLGKPAPMSVHYRLAGRGFTFQSVEMKDGSAAIPAARAGETIYYYLQARDETTHFHGSGKEPHEIAIHAATPPEVRHTAVTVAHVGRSLPVSAAIRTALPPAAVRLYYRHLDQSEDWAVRDMQLGASGYAAEIPGEFIVPGWDLMYMIEVVDRGGNGVFYPERRERNPFLVIAVKSAGL
jgi:hypothetical protein